MGLPAIVVTLAANQIPITSELSRRGLVQWVGHALEVSQAAFVDALRNLCSTGISSDWSRRCHQAVDGGGVERVLSVLTLNSQTKLSARRAHIGDELVCLEWANYLAVKDNTCEANRNKKEIVHKHWFRRRLSNLETCRQYVIETENSLEIGLVCFDYVSGRWEIDCLFDSVALANGLAEAMLECAIHALRTNISGSLLFEPESTKKITPIIKSEQFKLEVNCSGASGRLSIAICSDAGSWINPFLPTMVLACLLSGHNVEWSHSATDLKEGDVCFYLSFSRIVDSATRSRFKNNIVVHESDLPKGRGWSPMSWLILAGECRIPVTLLEAVEQVDAGDIYIQEWIDLTGYELSGEWRELQACATLRLCKEFISQYPAILSKARRQDGPISFYPRRCPQDSELDPNKTIAEQFNLLRAVDNKDYPAFFDFAGKRFFLHIVSE